MSEKILEIGDYVWAKLKGFPFWPGKIVEPPTDSKPKAKKSHYIYFFGSENYAWVVEENILLHSEYNLKKCGMKKGASFLKALQSIIEETKDNPKYHESMHNAEKISNESIDMTILDDAVKIEEGSEMENPHTDNCSKTIRKKLSLKNVLPVKPLSEKKSLRKRTRSSKAGPSASFSSRSEDADTSKPGVSKDDVYLPSFKDLQNKIKNERLQANKSPSPNLETKERKFLERHVPTSEDRKNKNMEASGSSFTEDKMYMSARIPEMQNENLQAPRTPPPKPEAIKREFIERPVSPTIDMKDRSPFVESRGIIPTKKKIGFLGLNKVSQALVRNLYHSGHSMIVLEDTLKGSKGFSAKSNFKIVKTPSEVVRAADITFNYMIDPDAVRDLFFENSGVLNEFASSTKVRKGYVELSTLDPKFTQQIGNEIRVRGGYFLEAPTSGSLSQSSNGLLFILASGDQILYEECKSCLDAISQRNQFMSPETGSATKMNVVNQMLDGVATAGLAESVGLLEAIGLKEKITPEHFKEMLKNVGLDCPFIFDKVDCMMNQNYTTDVPLKHMQEQFTLGLALGDEVSQRTSIFAAAKEMYKKGVARQYGDHDISAVFETTKP